MGGACGLGADHAPDWDLCHHYAENHSVISKGCYIWYTSGGRFWVVILLVILPATSRRSKSLWIIVQLHIDIFHYIQAPDTPATYSYPLRAILAIIPFTAGDIGIDGVFYTNTEAGSPIGREYETLAFIIWICALIIMSILFNNLLVRFHLKGSFKHL